MPSPSGGAAGALVPARRRSCSAGGCDTGDGRDARRRRRPGATAPPLATLDDGDRRRRVGRRPPVGSAERRRSSLTQRRLRRRRRHPRPALRLRRATTSRRPWPGRASPPDVVELALTVVDPDAPGEPFVHWVVDRHRPGRHRLRRGRPARGGRRGAARGSVRARPAGETHDLRLHAVRPHRAVRDRRPTRPSRPPWRPSSRRPARRRRSAAPTPERPA